MSINKVQEMIEIWGGGINWRRRKQLKSKLTTDEFDLAKLKQNLKSKSINITTSKTNKKSYAFPSQNCQITEDERLCSEHDTDTDITDIDDEQYMYEYTEQDLATENIGIVEYKVHTKSSPSISQTLIQDTVSETYDDDEYDTNDYQIKRQKEIALDLYDLFNINVGDSDAEYDILETLFIKYKISQEIIDTLKYKLHLCRTDSIEKLLQNKPTDIISVLNMEHSDMSLKECICLYQLIHHCVAGIGNGQYAYKLSNQVQQCWKHFNNTRIIFNISAKTDQGIKYNKLNQLNTVYNYKKNILMNGNQMKNIWWKKIKNETKQFAISIGKLGYKMNLWMYLSNGKQTQKIQMDENGTIYVNDVYKDMVIPYNDKYIDSGSVISCKINKRTHGQNDEMKIKMKHKKYGKTVSKSKGISLKFDGHQRISLILKISQEDGRGEYSLL